MGWDEGIRIGRLLEYRVRIFPGLVCEKGNGRWRMLLVVKQSDTRRSYSCDGEFGLRASIGHLDVLRVLGGVLTDDETP